MSSFFPGISKTISDTKIILLYIESPCPREYLDQNLLTSENRPNMTLSVPCFFTLYILLSPKMHHTNKKNNMSRSLQCSIVNTRTTQDARRRTKTKSKKKKTNKKLYETHAYMVVVSKKNMADNQ